MENVITINTMRGKNVHTGEEVEVQTNGIGLDEIKCNGQRIGFCDHREGAGVRFLRVLSDVTKDEICRKVAALRKEQGKPGISGKHTAPPSPEALREAMQEDEEGDDE